jgi:UDP-xylose/UDP-N-acetylglucosamine transporter B4
MTLFALPAPDFDAFTAAAVGTAVKPLFRWHELAVPRAFLALALNVITQGVCIRGVNRLTTVSCFALYF